ncbi:hypothetical protein HYALB_00005068 [Hymenoscyphus albidus]|uniref:Nicotianamine synthase n=1 Tax=Hymenoscyphus albidus TaxID=595503 RepID=A0A9N9PXH4_9HELO|nr:hypothetical protein HYALB_00005068 [Hymenoscyphus albidus]
MAQLSPPSSASSTPTYDQIAEKVQVESLITQILNIHARLQANSEDLKPCPTVNGLFGELMGICLMSIPDATSQQILTDPRILRILPSLHSLCSQAEFELESFWSRKISGVGRSQAEKELHSFPYYSNYVDLTRLELASLYGIDPRPIRKVAFIGSGPLPLTSLCALEQLNAQLPRPNPKSWSSWFRSILKKDKKAKREEIEVLNIDHSSTAITISQKLCQNLGPVAKGMSFHLGSAESEVSPPSSPSLSDKSKPKDSPSSDLSDYDVVFLAALVGATQVEKETTLRSIVSRMRPGALLVVRSVAGMRGLCYPVFDPTTPGVIGDGSLELCAVVHPKTHVVNSVVVARVGKRVGLIG